MKHLVDETCPMFGKKCRHCSMEKTSRPYMKVVKDPATKLFKPAGLGRSIVELGAFCNDEGKYIANMHYCPVGYDKMKAGGRYGPAIEIKKGLIVFGNEYKMRKKR